MKNFEITKEQILQIHNSGKIDLKRWFPEAFKTELEVGKWYKNKYGSLFCLEEINRDFVAIGYGFLNGIWIDYEAIWLPEDDATPQEVEKALFAEAKKRGYKSGVFCEFGTMKDVREIKGIYFVYNEIRNGLYIGNDEIFKNGKWAPIVETITKSEAEIILNKKIV